MSLAIEGNRPALAGEDPRRRDIELFATEIHRYVARRVANPADAADLAQQALMLAFEKLPAFRNGLLRAWLFTIARHVIVDHYRSRNRARMLELSDEFEESEPALHTAPDLPVAACYCRERVNDWLECIARRLRLDEQVAVLLADVYGYRDRESSEMLRMTLPCFKLMLHGARACLRAEAGCTLVGSERCATASTRRGRSNSRLTLAELRSLRERLVNELRTT
ncbi:MAG: hypothetical protein KBD01_12025 [Acidobacteria bacterium]|nr:hypothetical protein [Acidobacteriota bacterium]